MLEIKKLSKSYHHRRVLKDINLLIEKGDVIGIIGPTNCGKSTLLKCMNLLEKPTSGHILFEEKDLFQQDHLEEFRSKIGMVFQQSNLFEDKTVLENLTLAPVLLKKMNKVEAAKEALSLLQQIGLKDKVNQFPQQLTGGQRKKVAIARCMMLRCEVLLLDDPTFGVETEMISEVMALIQELVDDGMTLVITSQEIHLIEKICNKVVFMDDGAILEQGSSDAIFKHPVNERLIQYLFRIKNI